MSKQCCWGSRRRSESEGWRWASSTLKSWVWQEPWDTAGYVGLSSGQQPGHSWSCEAHLNLVSGNTGQWTSWISPGAKVKPCWRNSSDNWPCMASWRSSTQRVRALGQPFWRQCRLPQISRFYKSSFSELLLVLKKTSIYHLIQLCKAHL
jgi:hypothetical protein